MKIMTILGTRPDLIKMSRVLPVLDEAADEHIFVHTGQNYDYELNGIFFDQLGIRKPDYFMYAADPNPSKTVATIIEKADYLYERYKPDAVLFYGDTNSVMAVYPAKRRKIPIFHMEAGNRSFNALVPEETNRKIIDHLADVNMVNSEHARRYLLAEGLPAERIIKTGSPMKEVISHSLRSIEQSDVLERLNLEQEKYFLVSMHREANVDDKYQLVRWCKEFYCIAVEYNIPIVFSCHPRTQKRIEDTDFLESTFSDDRIRIMPPLGFFDYCNLQMNAKCTISDSGTITEEASLLKFPAVTIRKAHERPEGMDEGVVAMCGNPSHLSSAIDLKVREYEELEDHELVPDYDVPQISYKVANTILSYTDYVNRIVWRKHL